jgi:6-phosphogluconolactonase (cycloisomerase 2 family)
VGSLVAVGEYLYATSSGDQVSTPGTVSGYRIMVGCALEPLPGSPWRAGFGSAGIAATDEAVFVANWAESTLQVFDINHDGSLDLRQTLSQGPNQGPFDMEVDSRGRYLFLNLHTFSKIAVFRIGRHGALTSVVDSPFDIPAMFLAGLTLSPNGRWLFDGDPRNRTVHVRRIGPNGALQIVGPGSMTLPRAARDLLVHRRGRLLFATSHSGELHVFRIDPDGSLSPVGTSPVSTVGNSPVGLAQDPRGQFLFVTQGGQAGPGPPSFINSIAVYRIGRNGSLQLVDAPYPLGIFGFSAGVLHWSQPADRGRAVVPGGVVP